MHDKTGKCPHCGGSNFHDPQRLFLFVHCRDCDTCIQKNEIFLTPEKALTIYTDKLIAGEKLSCTDIVDLLGQVPPSERTELAGEISTVSLIRRHKDALKASYEAEKDEPVITSLNDMHTAWRALAKVNPDNPMAVAEAVPELVEALEGVLSGACGAYNPKRCTVNKLAIDMIRKVLAKIHAPGGGD